MFFFQENTSHTNLIWHARQLGVKNFGFSFWSWVGIYSCWECLAMQQLPKIIMTLQDSSINPITLNPLMPEFFFS